MGLKESPAWVPGSFSGGRQVKTLTGHSGLRSSSYIPAVGSFISPAREPPLWNDCDAQTDEGVHIEPDWDLAAQPAPDYEVDQLINW